MMGLKTVLAATAAAILAAAPAMPEQIIPWADLSAVGILGVIVWLLFMDRHRALKQADKWERVRHQDSEKLHECLNNLTVNCTRAQERAQAYIDRQRDDESAGRSGIIR